MDSDTQIRLADPRDIDAIAEFNMAMAWETEHMLLSRDTLIRGVGEVFARPEHGFYIVAETDGQVVGCLLVTFEWSDWRCGQFWWIQSLYIRPMSRRRGIFRQLHEFVKAQALHQGGVCGIRLYVEQSNHLAQQAYQQIGMRARSYRMYEQMLSH